MIRPARWQHAFSFSRSWMAMTGWAARGVGEWGGSPAWPNAQDLVMRRANSMREVHIRSMKRVRKHTEFGLPTTLHMPLLPTTPFLAHQAFDREIFEVMSDAFVAACDALHLKASDFLCDKSCRRESHRTRAAICQAAKFLNALTDRSAFCAFSR